MAKREKHGKITLASHLALVGNMAEKIAAQVGLDPVIAFKGGILHDIGKASPTYQKAIKDDYNPKPGTVFRHERARRCAIRSVDNPTRNNQIVSSIIADRWPAGGRRIRIGRCNPIGHKEFGHNPFALTVNGVPD